LESFTAIVWTPCEKAGFDIAFEFKARYPSIVIIAAILIVNADAANNRIELIFSLPINLVVAACFKPHCLAIAVFKSNTAIWEEKK